MRPVTAQSNTGWDVFPHRILSHYREAQAIARGALPPPRMVIWHLNYLCNHHCVGCDFRAENAALHYNPPARDLTRIAAAIIASGAEAVELSGGGEPLLAPGVDRLIRTFRRAGLQVGLLTNGSLLTGRVLTTVVRHCRYVRISMEAGSPAVFRRVKQVDDPREFARIVANLRAAVALKRKLRAPININLKYTVGTLNRHDLANAALLAARLGVDSLQFRPYENCAITPRDTRAIQRDVTALRQRYAGKLEIVGNLAFARPQTRCRFNALFATVDGMGDVFLCPYYRHRRARHRIGNLLRDDWTAVWGGKRHRAARAAVRPAECAVYACRFHRYNALLTALLSSGDLSFI
ncbi:MAG TPA: radical SAM protein [bacterium]|nr:radical SAM protein [bacterium]